MSEFTRTPALFVFRHPIWTSLQPRFSCSVISVAFLPSFYRITNQRTTAGLPSCDNPCRLLLSFVRLRLFINLGFKVYRRVRWLQCLRALSYNTHDWPRRSNVLVVLVSHCCKALRSFIFPRAFLFFT